MSEAEGSRGHPGVPDIGNGRLGEWLAGCPEVVVSEGINEVAVWGSWGGNGRR
jgi:hypothetical protein